MMKAYAADKRFAKNVKVTALPGTQPNDVNPESNFLLSGFNFLL